LYRGGPEFTALPDASPPQKDFPSHASEAKQTSPIRPQAPAQHEQLSHDKQSTLTQQFTAPKSPSQSVAAEQLRRNIDELMEGRIGFEKRWNALQNFVNKTNPDSIEALNKFNQHHHCSLRCIGIQRFDHVAKSRESEFVFVNTFEGTNPIPLRIGIPYGTWKNAKGSDTLATLLEKNFSTQLEDTTVIEKGDLSLKKQYELWKKHDTFDLPKHGKTTLMAVYFQQAWGAKPAALADQLRSVYIGHYGAKIDKMVVENAALWDYFLQQAKMDPTGLPKPKEIDELRPLFPQIRESLATAVKEGQQAFVLSYLMHGQNVKGGSVSANSEKGKQPAERIAQELAAPDRNGKPLCAQIDILIVAESCYSGRQLTGIIDYLRRNKIPVKNLRIITASNLTTAAFWTTNASATNERTPQSLDFKTPPMSYYLSYYFQMMDYHRSKGVKLAPGADTFGHAARFADRMARNDSFVSDPSSVMEEQDLQYYHYSTEQPADEYLSDSRKEYQRATDNTFSA
jgi:hypothetical protein